MLGMPLAALIPPGDLPSYQARLRKIQQKGTIVAEAIHQRKDGSIFPVEASGRTIKIEDKPYLQEIIRDITERKRAEEAARAADQRLVEQHRREKEQVAAELAKAREELVRTTRLAAIGQISASIAHDLRNPLGAARNAIYYLRNYLARDDPRLKEYVGIIDSEIGSADRIIGNMLEMACDRAPARQAVDLGQLVGEVLAAAREAKGIRCRVALTPDPFLVHADPGQLRQVVANLLTNAAQAMESGGEWSVEATRDQETDTILFRDTGPGIPPEVRENLFEPLVTTRAAGIGLGLTICRQIVERHGGTIDVVDHEGEGAMFRVRLPRDRRHEPSD
jgi:signal transduction histidine kinase